VSGIDVSIVLVNWNTRDILCNCLRSVYEQTEHATFEVIVVDNASSDGSHEMVRRQWPQVRLICNNENRGFAAANNQGIELADGRYVLLLNSDTIVLDGAIQKTFVFAEQHPEAAVVSCRVLNGDGTLQHSCFKFPSLFNLLLSVLYLNKLFPRSKLFGREEMTWWDKNDVRQVDVVAGCYMLVRREAIEQVGRLDTDYFMYGEETDWCWRFRRAGWNNLFFPGADIIHLGGQSSKQVRSEMLLQMRAGILQFFHKNRTRGEYALACFLTSMWFALRIVPWCIIGVFCTGRRCEAQLMVRTYLRGAVKCFGGWQALAVKR
jgi:GT2 family glycosyltransferase